jgi:hypothetical protein
MNRFPIPRPTETAALAHVGPRVLPAPEALFADAAVCTARRDLEGLALLGHLIVRAAACGRVGER